MVRKSTSQVVFGVPVADWHHTRAYPPLTRTRYWDWAWEFLRRNPEYQSCWNQEIAKFTEFRPGVGAPLCISPWAEEHNLYIDQWGIEALVDPLISEYAGYVQFPVHLPWMASKIAAQKGIRLGESQIAIVLDLTRPLKPQLGETQIIFQSEKSNRQKLAKSSNPGKNALPFVELEKGTRERRREWSDYLRVLDALASGVQDREIADTLYETVRNEYPDYNRMRLFRDSRDRAIQLRDGGYRGIAALQRYPKKS